MFRRDNLNSVLGYLLLAGTGAWLLYLLVAQVFFADQCVGDIIADNIAALRLQILIFCVLMILRPSTTPWWLHIVVCCQLVALGLLAHLDPESTWPFIAFAAGCAGVWLLEPPYRQVEPAGQNQPTGDKPDKP